MKLIFFVFLVLFSLSLYGAMGSSVSIPTQQHLKYTFGNHLRDVASELVSEVNVIDPAAKHLHLYVDPSNGVILKTETQQ
jgi:hypothetical protein